MITLFEGMLPFLFSFLSGSRPNRLAGINFWTFVGGSG